MELDISLASLMDHTVKLALHVLLNFTFLDFSNEKIKLKARNRGPGNGATHKYPSQKW